MRVRCLGMWAVAAVALAAWPAYAGPYTDIDRHALSVPASAEGSVQTLASALTAPARDDTEKARAIFRWMAGHIAYDEAAYRSGRYGSDDPLSVLRRRQSVCGGYARLFEALARAAGLEVVTVSGHGKGAGYRLGEAVTESNHDWNAVKLDGRWYLIDTTWGAGAVINGQWQLHFTEHYFLTPPDEFIYDHLPTDAKWQLLDPPLSREEYRGLVHLRPPFFQQGLKVESHPRSHLAAGDSACLTFGGPEGVQFLAQLSRDGGESVGRQWALCQRVDGRYQVLVRFPRAGRYYLKLFARGRGEAGPLWEAAGYVIQARAGAACGFPVTYNTFGERGAVLHQPRSGVLRAGRPEVFSLTVPGAQEVSVVSGGRWQRLSRRGDTFTGAVRPARGKLQVVAETFVLAEYQAR